MIKATINIIIQMKNSFYITTTLPYVNAKPHIGFAMEIIRADVMARFYRQQLGKENVFFNTGTDEHGQKIYQKSVEQNKDPQKYCDEYAEKFEELKRLLNLSYDNFIRTTDEHHIKAAQEFWKICNENGHIYKKNYKVKYCVGCELEKTDSELVDGKCPLHPDQDLETIEEENYFFKFSNFKDKLLEFYKNNPEFVLPKKRFNEIIRFIEAGPQDFSISRLKSKMPWGVEVPGDPEQVMYVWFDALVNYISALGWPNNKDRFEKFWPGMQVCGKDNLRQQSAMWQAMLMAAGLSNSERVFVNGFINVDGQKMSKSLGNVITPEEMVEKFGVDGTRYLLLSFGPFGEDWDVSWEKFTEKYNADLANGLGNLIARVFGIMEKNQDFIIPNLTKKDISQAGEGFYIPQTGTMYSGFKKDFEAYIEIMNDIFTDSKYVNYARFERLLDLIFSVFTQKADRLIEESKLWDVKKIDPQFYSRAIYALLESFKFVAYLINPFLPETSEKIYQQLGLDKTQRTENKKLLEWGVLKPDKALGKKEILFYRKK